jgi:hypothetical protein
MSDAAPDHVVVLADRNTQPGLLVLLNSLARNGFDGTAWIGQRATEPLALPPDAVASLPFAVELVTLDSERPFTYLKADAVAHVWAVAGPTANSVSYMDCDLILDREWAFVRAWIGDSVAVVEDQPGRRVGALHPVRGAWSEFITACGEEVIRTPDLYYNAGFVGVSNSASRFIEIWQHISLMLERTAIQEGPELPFVRGHRDKGAPPELSETSRILLRQVFLEDQDGFNMTIMATDVSLRSMGPDAMGFTGARSPVLAHAVGPDKPWATPYVRRLLKHGVRVSVCDDAWWKYAFAPILVASGPGWRRRRLEWLIAKAAGRLIGR